MKDKKTVLIAWLCCSLIWDIFVFGGISYFVFFKGSSGWWFLFGIAATYQPTMYQALKEYFNLL
jgi:hypothetical protein